MWENELSSPQQVLKHALSNPNRRIPIFIAVSDVRSICITDMDVVWDHLNRYPGLPDNFPGAEGHCAIIGWPEGKGDEKVKRRQVRNRLAEMAHREEEVELEEPQ